MTCRSSDKSSPCARKVANTGSFISTCCSQSLSAIFTPLFWFGSSRSPDSAFFREVGCLDDHRLQIVLARPADDAGALLAGRRDPEQEQQPLLALVLEQLAQRQPAIPPDARKLLLRMKPRRGAGAEREG